jgi:predicted TPR repeat methyltransferase
MAEEAWLAGLPRGLRQPLQRAAAGLPANVALMHLCMACTAPDEAEGALRSVIDHVRQAGEAIAAARLQAVLDLLSANPQAFEIVRSVIGGLDHAGDAAGEEALAYWVAAFDRAAAQNPEASVALYSLGDPRLLEAATREIVDRLAEWALISPATECLDIGCGIGRFELALSGRVRRIVGIDISRAMVATARRRVSHLPNAEVRLTSGRDVAEFQDESFDLVLAVDAFPYIVQASLAPAMVAESARVLRPGGALAILNFSYRGDPDRDRADVAALASAAGLEVRRNGTADLSLWDGITFELRKP